MYATPGIIGVRYPSAELIDRPRKNGHPLVVTIKGKAEVVVQDAGADQTLRDRLLAAIEGIQRRLADVKTGRTKPARQVFNRLRRKVNRAGG